MNDLKKAPSIAILLCIALAGVSLSQSASPDLQIEKIASDLYSYPLTDGQWASSHRISEVGPSETFYYLIRVANPQGPAAVNLVVKDWLPDDVANVSVLEPNEGVLVVGSIVTVDLPVIEPQTARYIAIRAVSPDLGPATLYNYADLRCLDDSNSSNDRDGITVHVRPISYTKQDSIASYEDLLRSQADLLAGFEDLLHAVTSDQRECYKFIASYEQLLRTQTVLFSRFEELLFNSTGEGWDSDMNLSDQTNFLNSYEDLLRREANLYSGFEQKINDSWSALGADYRYDPDGPGGLPAHNATAQRELLASFEDLLRRQAALYDGFQGLENGLNSSVSYEDQVKFLASFEDLLRRESNLLLKFEDLIMRLFLSV